MKKYLLAFSLFATASLFSPLNAFYLQVKDQKMKSNIPVPVIKAANNWAYENGLLPETPPPDYLRAFYTKMSKNTWEVHWMWSKSGVTGEARLLITNGGNILNVY